MPSAFKSKIAAVGLVPADGAGGIALERAAVVMSELQDKNGKPLTGDKLDSAARTWADKVGLTVAKVAEDNITTGPVVPAPEETT
jgi:hypothetical protein